MISGVIPTCSLISIGSPPAPWDAEIEIVRRKYGKRLWFHFWSVSYWLELKVSHSLLQLAERQGLPEGQPIQLGVWVWQELWKGNRPHKKNMLSRYHLWADSGESRWPYKSRCYVLYNWTYALQLTFSCSSDLFGESSNDSAGGIMLVEGMWQFLASSLQLLSQGEAVKHNSILEQRRKEDEGTLLSV